jgi:exopolyphosphatase/guanosine-5'-triphosphate,3'-diphosphate pyrophosphatase
MRVWPTERLSVADRGLREGLLYALMSADGALRDGIEGAR